MRTKHILFSVALCAAFTACTSDEEFKMVAENNGADAMLSIRPEVGSDITFGDEVLTRLALGGGARPAWGENDKVGAAIIDVPNYVDEAAYAAAISGGSKPIALYNIASSLGCNNAFSTTDGGETWSAEHPMVEGNYLFYAPYQEGLSLRTPLVIEVPEIQDATEEKSALEQFYNGNYVVQVGYKFITADERKRPAVTLYNAFAYPKFTIKNNFNGYLFETAEANAVSSTKYNGEITVDSIQFINVDATSNRTADQTFIVGGQLNHGTVGNSATNQDGGIIFELKQKDNGFTADGNWWDLDKMLNSVQTKDLINDSYKIVADRMTSKAGVITTLKVEKEIAQGASLDLYCVMPAYKFNFGDDQLMAKIYVTIDGKQYQIYDAVFASNAVKLSAAADAGYLFDAKNNSGLSSLSFMAGQSLPSEAIRLENGSYKVKTDVKDLFTIELKGGDKKAGATSNVQIAVRTSADVNNDGFKNNEELIEAIKNAANGTNWVENATSSASEKGFKIAQTNTVVINSELIDALAGNNQNGGAFTIETVVPISNDVKVKAVNGTKVTFVSNTNKEYDITLKGAVTDGSSAEDKYAIINAQVPSDFNENTVAIVTGTQSISATKLKSLHVSASGNATLTAALVAGNIRVDGTLTTGSNDVTADEIYNSGTINVSKTITGTVSNNGTISIQANTASVTISSGTGKVIMTEGQTTLGVKVGTEANQEVIYKCTGDLATAQIQDAASISSVNSIQVNSNGKVTLTVSDMAEFKNIKTLYADATIETKDNGTYDMSALNIVLTKAATWSGNTASQSIVTGVKVNISAYNLTLETIAVSGTATATTGKVIADGVSATWNGGASGQN